MAVELGLGSTQFQSLGLLPVSQQKKMDRNKYYFFCIKSVFVTNQSILNYVKLFFPILRVREIKKFILI